MDISGLSRDEMFSILLKTPVDDVFFVCRASSMAQSICDQDFFWEEYMRHNLDYSDELIRNVKASSTPLKVATFARIYYPNYIFIPLEGAIFLREERMFDTGSVWLFYKSISRDKYIEKITDLIGDELNPEDLDLITDDSEEYAIAWEINSIYVGFGNVFGLFQWDIQNPELYNITTIMAHIRYSESQNQWVKDPSIAYISRFTRPIPLKEVTLKPNIGVGLWDIDDAIV